MNRGEVWLVALDPTIGAAIKKSRPAVIVSSDEIGILPLRVIVPLTEWRGEFREAPWLVAIAPTRQNGLSKTSAADAFQVKSVSTLRLRKRLGALSSADITRIVTAVGAVIEHPSS